MMKILAAFSLALALAARLASADAAGALAVYAAPDAASPRLGELPAGAAVALPAPGSADATALPPGWARVQLPGPLDVWVKNGDIGKDLDLKPGAIFYAKPDEASPTLGSFAPPAQARIIRPEGDWCLVKLSSPVSGFVQLQAPPPAGPSFLPVSAAPASPADAGRLAPAATEQDKLPRIFEGRFETTTRLLGIGPSLRYQLLDTDGNRVVLLDVSRLMQTEDFARFVGRMVAVRGIAVRGRGGKDIVIQVETLVLK